MKRLKVIGAFATFNSGYVELSDAQARRRAHALNPIGDGVFAVVQPVTFKRGEELGFDGQINKFTMQEVEPVVDLVILPSAEDLDSVAAEQEVAAETSKPRKRGKKK